MRVVEVDTRTGKEYDRTRFARNWAIKEGYENLEDGQIFYIQMKNAQHRLRRGKERAAGRAPKTLMKYLLTD